MNSETAAACTGPLGSKSDVFPEPSGGKWTQAPIPNQEAVSHPQLITKKNLIITNGVSLDTQTVLEGGHVPSSRWPPQNKLSGTLGDFISHTALFGHFKSLFAWILRVMILVLWFYSCVYVCLSVCISWAFSILFGFQIFKNSLNFFLPVSFLKKKKEGVVGRWWGSSRRWKREISMKLWSEYISIKGHF